MTLKERRDDGSEEEVETSAEHLAAESGKPAEDFEPDYDKYPSPDLDDLETVPIPDDE